jgi:hypothetical protein
MTFQHLDEALADDAGGTENSYRKFVGHDKFRFYTSEISIGNVTVDPPLKFCVRDGPYLVPGRATTTLGDYS